MIAKRFRNYTLLRKLAPGGMGQVYEASEVGTSRRVALKLIEHAADTDTLEVLEAERFGALLHTRLSSVDERIAKVYEFGDCDGQFFVVMEYVDGQDLADLLRDGGVGHLYAMRIAQDLCDILHRAHNFRTIIEGRECRGIVHGDIKPRNIRIANPSQTRLLDFGIAKALSLSRHFTANQFASTPYCSPERLNTGGVSIASDLWSVSVLLYELAFGHRYFGSGTTAEIEALVRGYSGMRELPESCPDPLRSILVRALSRDPALRFTSAASLAVELSNARHEMASQVKITASGCSDPGTQSINLERFHVDPDRKIAFIISPHLNAGVLGHFAEWAYQLLRARLERHTGTAEERIREAVAIANNHVLEIWQKEYRQRFPGISVIVAVEQGGDVVVGRTGDCVGALWIQRGTGMHLFQPAGNGGTHSSASPKKTTGIGQAECTPYEHGFVDIVRVPLAGASLLLHSRGLAEAISTAEITAIINQSYRDPQSIGAQVLNKASWIRPRPNLTLALMMAADFAPPH